MPGVNLTRPRPHVATVTLDRPPVNALDTDTRRALLSTVDELQADPEVRAVVLTAAGRVFCAGADVKEKAGLHGSAAELAEADRLTRSVFFALRESRKPIVAAVNGAAIGAGLVILSCCDVIISADHAVFAMPEIDVGQGGGASFLRRVLPPMLVRRMVLTADRVSAEELHRLGVVDRCLPCDDVLAAAIETAGVIAKKSPAAVRAIRDSFATVEELSTAEAFRFEQGYTAVLAASPDGAEARQAFIEKRPPKF